MPLLVRGQVDKVYLNNNSVIYGNVVHLNQDSVTLRLEHSIVKLSTDEVEFAKIRGGAVNSSDIDVDLLDSINRSSSSKAFNKILLFKVLVGGEVRSNDVFAGASAIGVYRFRPLLQVGAGVAYEVYTSFYSIPAFVYYRGHLSPRSRGMFYYGAFGYARVGARSNPEVRYDKIKGGAIIKLGVGHDFDVNNVYFITCIGWTQQKMTGEGEVYNFWGGNTRTITSRTMNRLEFSIGIYI